MQLPARRRGCNEPGMFCLAGKSFQCDRIQIIVITIRLTMDALIQIDNGTMSLEPPGKRREYLFVCKVERRI